MLLNYVLILTDKDRERDELTGCRSKHLNLHLFLRQNVALNPNSSVKNNMSESKLLEVGDNTERERLCVYCLRENEIYVVKVMREMETKRDWRGSTQYLGLYVNC